LSASVYGLGNTLLQCIFLFRALECSLSYDFVGLLSKDF
jgi:hypothetical protein